MIIYVLVYRKIVNTHIKSEEGSKECLPPGHDFAFLENIFIEFWWRALLHQPERTK